MADVLIMYDRRPDVPMVITEKQINEVKKTAAGEVYWCGTEEQALREGIDAEVLFIWGGSGKQPEEYCGKSRKLKWIHTFSAGVNPLMESSICKLPIKLTNAKGIHGETMALTTLGYIISFLRDFPGMYRKQQKHIWKKSFDPLPREAAGLTVCVLGAGAIGGEVARNCKSLGMRVIGVKRKVVPLEYYDEVYPSGQMNEAIAQADFLVVLTPLSSETYHLVDAPRLNVMKPTAVLINISRGAVIDEAALIEALKSGKIAGAALDAVENEPLSPDSPLWDMENVILTPHCSADSSQYIDRAIAQFCENLKRYEAGEPLFNEIDLAVNK